MYRNNGPVILDGSDKAGKVLFACEVHLWGVRDRAISILLNACPVSDFF